MSFKEFLTEGDLLNKLKKWVIDFDRKYDPDGRTNKEVVQQIKELSDETLQLWYKNGNNIKFGTALRMFQNKAVEREMQRRGLI